MSLKFFFWLLRQQILQTMVLLSLTMSVAKFTTYLCLRPCLSWTLVCRIPGYLCLLYFCICSTTPHWCLCALWAWITWNLCHKPWTSSFLSPADDRGQAVPSAAAGWQEAGAAGSGVNAPDVKQLYNQHSIIEVDRNDCMQCKMGFAING